MKKMKKKRKRKNLHVVVMALFFHCSYFLGWLLGSRRKRVALFINRWGCWEGEGEGKRKQDRETERQKGTTEEQEGER